MFAYVVRLVGSWWRDVNGIAFTTLIYSQIIVLGLDVLTDMRILVKYSTNIYRIKIDAQKIFELANCLPGHGLMDTDGLMLTSSNKHLYTSKINPSVNKYLDITVEETVEFMRMLSSFDPGSRFPNSENVLI